MLTAHACAKINLGLRVLRKRADGYHDIDTILLRIGWFDLVAVAHASQLTLHVDDDSIPDGEDNLCYAAARALQRKFSATSGAAISLEKRVPAGAGLGGGSADAAATLYLLNKLWNLHADADQLRKIGATLGSDIPFFASEWRVARGTGRGDRLIPIDDYDFPFSLLVVVPEARVNTAWAYEVVTPHVDRQSRELVDIVRTNDLSVWRRELRNDFEVSVAERLPEVASIRDLLYRQGAGYASLSGSGSAVYGVFDDPRGARKAAAALGDVLRASVITWTGTASL